MPPHTPFPERPPRTTGGWGGGWHGESPTSLFNTLLSFPWKREAGSLQPAGHLDVLPRGRGEEKGGLKDQASFFLPLLGDGLRPPPSLPPSSSPRPGLVGPRTAGQEAGGCGEGALVWLPYRHLGTLQGVQAPDGKKRGKLSCVGRARLGTPRNGLAHLGMAPLESSWLPTAEEPPGEARGESELQEHEAGLPRACLSPGHTAAGTLLPHLPQR